MSERPDQTEGRRIYVAGESPQEIAVDSLPSHLEESVSRKTVGFECASGDWIERECEALPVSELVEAAKFPADTTHVVVESTDGYRACVPISALPEAIIAIGDGPGKPRFVSPAVIGPRAIKNLESVEPRSLDPDADPEEYERLPIDNK